MHGFVSVVGRVTVFEKQECRASCASLLLLSGEYPSFSLLTCVRLVL